MTQHTVPSSSTSVYSDKPYSNNKL